MKRLLTVMIAGMLAFLAISPAEASPVQPTADQRTVLSQYGVRGGVVVDSAMSYEQAIGDDKVPAEGRAIHAAMRPLLRVVPVAYWGLGSDARPDGRVHVGQIVVHKALVQDTLRTFLKMFQLKFPIRSVIPQSAFGYSDQASMAANNSSNYRPEDGSEHGRGAAFDLNPVQNPFDTSAYNGAPVEPAGATYDPAKPGTVVKEGAVRKYWTSLHYEWGGGWGDPAADPPTDFFRVGYFDYQHFQLDYARYGDFVAQLPPCLQDWTCA